MDSTKNEPIRLSEVETETLTRALVEAQAEAEGPIAGQTDTQQFRRASQVRPPKAGTAPQGQSQSTGSTSVI